MPTPSAPSYRNRHKINLENKTKKCSRNPCVNGDPWQPWDSFYIDDKSSTGLSSACKACLVASCRKWHEDNKDAVKKRAALRIASIRGDDGEPKKDKKSKECTMSEVKRVHSDNALEKICPDANCPYGGKPQPLNNFYKNAARYDGLQNYCKECNRRINDERKATRRKPVEFGDKVCTICKISQPVDNFTPSTVGRDGRYPRCKSCVAKLSAEYYTQNFDSVSSQKKQHRTVVRDRNAAKLQEYWNSLASGGEEKYKICIDCGGEPQPYSNFHVNLEFSDGLSKKCKPCLRKSDNDRYHRNREKNWAKHIVSSIKARALKNNLLFNIDESDLQNKPEYCPFFGVKLDYMGGPDRRLWASVDRIIPKMGYVKGNIRIISNAANYAKLDGDDSIFAAIKLYHSL